MMKQFKSLAVAAMVLAGAVSGYAENLPSPSEVTPTPNSELPSISYPGIGLKYKYQKLSVVEGAEATFSDDEGTYPVRLWAMAYQEPEESGGESNWIDATDVTCFLEALPYLSDDGNLDRPGTYTLTIPAGSLTDAAGNTNAQLQYTWTIVLDRGNADFDPVGTTPEVGSKVSVAPFTNLIVTFPTAVTLAVSSEENRIESAYVASNGNATDVTLSVSAEDPNSVVVEYAFDAEGIYTVVIPEGNILNADNHYNSQLNYYVKVGNPAFGVYDFTPGTGSYAGFNAGQVFTGSVINVPAETYSLSFQLYGTEKDKAGEYGPYISTSDVYVQADGSFMFELPNNVTLYEDNTYYWAVTRTTTTHSIETLIAHYDGVTYTGTAVGMKISDVQLTEISPNVTDVIASAENVSYDLTFSGNVGSVEARFNLSQMGLGAKIPCKPLYDGDKTVWSMEFDASSLEDFNSAMMVNIEAYDEQGNPIQAAKKLLRLESPYTFMRVVTNVADEEKPFITVEFTCVVGAPEVQLINPATMPVKELSSFTFSNPGKDNPAVASDINFSNYSFAEAWLECPDGSKIDLDKDNYKVRFEDGTEFDSANPGDGQADAKSEAITFYLVDNQTVTEPGDYVLHMGYGWFALGNQFAGCTSKPQNFKLKVSGETGVEAIETIAERGDVFNLMGVRVLRGATKSDVKNLAPGVYVFGGKKIFVK